MSAYWWNGGAVGPGMQGYAECTGRVHRLVRVVSEETAGAKPGDKIARIVRKPLLSGVVVASFPYPVT